ncbi:4Fe-4S dicluster domain-containing protein [Lentimicrobium sp.]|uniref:4Fe-4S dicluster domain-containing protein n=1 Tax=Lentimicrobium sp. TaxID=2034841 RepID=UPI00345E8580
MTKQIIFTVALLITLGIFAFTIRRIYGFFSLTKPFSISNWGRRVSLMMKVAIGQTKILRFPVIGLVHALVFWGFMVITLGSIEMVIDGLSSKERSMAFTGWFYDVVMASGDIMAYVIMLSMLIFLGRRLFLSVRRFSGIEMQKKSKLDALAALGIIFMLMVSLAGINLTYVQMHSGGYEGVYPLSAALSPALFGEGRDLFVLHEVSWWLHILLIFAFANILPYSKHFHVFTSVPNVLLSRLEPLGQLPNMESVTNEVRMMMNPETAFAPAPEGQAAPARFGVKDVEDVTWKNYLDSLACTECGRCTSVCPANITGKKLSPRKIFVDLRARMKEKGPGLLKDLSFDDGKSLVRDFISAEELWACTTCNACAQECPININHPTLIVDMRRYLVMEEATMPPSIASMLQNIQNNGAPWQYPAEDRMKWAEGL